MLLHALGLLVVVGGDERVPHPGDVLRLKFDGLLQLVGLLLHLLHDERKRNHAGLRGHEDGVSAGQHGEHPRYGVGGLGILGVEHPEIRGEQTHDSRGLLRSLVHVGDGGAGFLEALALEH